MGVAKWRANLGVVRVADAATSSPSLIFANAESVNIARDPIAVERLNAISRLPIGVSTYGFKTGFSINNAQGDATFFGYLLSCLLGADSFAAGTHTITAAATSEYLCVRLDDVLEKGSGTPTNDLIGGKLTSASIDFPKADFARGTFSGMGVDLGAPAAGLTPVIVNDADHAPLSWAAVQAATGFLKLGYNAAAVAQADDVMGVTLEITQVAEEGGVTLGSNQPTGINEGEISVEAVVRYEQAGGVTSTARKMHDAHESEQEIALDLKAIMGAHAFRTELLHGRVINSPRQDVGSGADSMLAEARIKFFQFDSDELVTVTVDDDFGAVYF